VLSLQSPDLLADAITQLTLQLVASEFPLKAWESRWSSA
jgi:hypothetical protein